MKNLWLLSLALSCFLCARAQSFKYRNYHFEWPPGQPPAIPVEEQFKNEDAVILEEKCIYGAGGNRIPSRLTLNSRANYFFIDETSGDHAPIVQKHLRIKFLTEQGIKKYSTFVLPESFDPSGDWSTVRPEIRDSIYRPKGEFECVRYFAARILKPDLKINAAKVSEKTQLEIEYQYQKSEKVYNWIFKITNLEPGDELELDYSYEGAYNHDPSARIFFNGEMPKQNFELTFRYPFSEYYVLTYSNGAEPVDSVMETIKGPTSTEYYFRKKNLPGGIREQGGRPHTQYPYITYYEHKRDFGLMDPKTQFITRPMPYPWSYVALPMVSYRVENLKNYMSFQNQSTRAMNEFLRTEKNKVSDTSMAAIMSSIQHTLNEEFNYQDDHAYKAADNSNENLGRFIESKMMRSLSRHRIYKELFIRLDRDYYASIFYDKRITLMDMNEYKPGTSLRFGYAAPYNGQFIFFYPKSYRFGYEANELPFYYEDIQTLLIPQMEPSDKKYEYVPKVNFTFVKTPFSGMKENIRITSALVNASLDLKSLSFQARIKLSGQFSTLMRGFYQYGDRDSTINPSYFNTIAAISDPGKDVQFDVTSTNKQFPYDASVSVNFTTQSAVTKAADGTYSIDLKNWFNNVVDEDFTADNRHLNYYPDFQFQDMHKYMIKFDSKIQVDAEPLQKNIHNGFADYSVTISQPDDSSILVETVYIVKPEYVPAIHVKDVQEVFDAIKDLNNSSLKLKAL